MNSARIATAPLQRYLDETLGGSDAIRATAMIGGGSCEVFALDRGSSQWVLRLLESAANLIDQGNAI